MPKRRITQYNDRFFYFDGTYDRNQAPLRGYMQQLIGDGMITTTKRRKMLFFYMGQIENGMPHGEGELQVICPQDHTLNRLWLGNFAAGAFRDVSRTNFSTDETVTYGAYMQANKGAFTFDIDPRYGHIKALFQSLSDAHATQVKQRADILTSVQQMQAIRPIPLTFAESNFRREKALAERSFSSSSAASAPAAPVSTVPTLADAVEDYEPPFLPNAITFAPGFS